MIAQEVIELLNLEPLSLEGGYFRQTYLSPEKTPQKALPPRYKNDMAFATAIYFLMTTDDFSAMHRLNTDEIYHFYLGDPVEMLLLQPDGSGQVCRLGNDLQAGMQPQKVVEKDVWQGSRLAPGGQFGFALMGATMAPGFAWEGFELGNKDILQKQYPAFAAMIAERVRRS